MKYIFILLTAVLAVTFFLIAHTLIDPDFGWHVELGKYIHTYGVPFHDPFSYSMPTYSFIDHEWLTNYLVFYWFRSVAGDLGLAIFYTFLALVGFYLLCRKFSSSTGIFFVSFIFSCIVVIPYFGIRPQVESWLFFSMFVVFLNSESLLRKYWFLIPFLSLIWVNFHGSFAVLLVTLFFVFVSRSITRRTIDIFSFSLFLVSLLATFINPYGGRIWYEVYQQITDTRLRWTINEWMPIFFDIQLGFMVYFSFSLFLFWKYRKNFDLEKKVLYSFFLFQAIFSRRHIPVWMIISLPYFISSLTYLRHEVTSNSFARARFRFVYPFFLFFLSVLVVLTSVLYFSSASHFRNDDFYPRAALLYLRTNSSSGNLFSYYGWGGYLIHAYPSNKVFIDGRMPSWKRSVWPASEEASAMDSYIDIVSGDAHYSTVFQKYSIDTILWPTSIPTSSTSYSHIFDSLFCTAFKWFGCKLSQGVPFLEQIAADSSWHEIYRDTVAVVYRRAIMPHE